MLGWWACPSLGGVACQCRSQVESGRGSLEEWLDPHLTHPRLNHRSSLHHCHICSCRPSPPPCASLSPSCNRRSCGASRWQCANCLTGIWSCLCFLCAPGHGGSSHPSQGDGPDFPEPPVPAAPGQKRSQGAGQGVGGQMGEQTAGPGGHERRGTSAVAGTHQRDTDRQ